jgi:hypothetical protein
MTTTADIGSLAAGLDGHVVKLGIGRKEKHGETLAFLFLGALPICCRIAVRSHSF